MPVTRVGNLPQETVTGGDRLATVFSEVGGPAPLLGICILQIGLREHSLMPTIIAMVSIALVPYLMTILLSRMGRVTDRFVSSRRQRGPILLGTLLVVLGGLATLALIDAPATMTLVAATAVLALVIIGGITIVWKISIHATIAAFFVGMQVALFGPIGLLAIIVLVAVAWARYQVRAHTLAQLIAGTALGGLLAGGYALGVAQLIN